MNRKTVIAATAVFALTAVMLFAEVVNAQQPVTATAQYKDYGYRRSPLATVIGREAATTGSIRWNVQ
jgi:hypothetical protein